MTAPAISARVLQFIADHIHTVPHIEALLLLWKGQQRSWTATEIAARIYVPVEVARTVLSALSRHKLVRLESSDTYQYEHAWDHDGTLMAEVAAEYSQHLVQITHYIHSNGSSAVREFARAFDLKKDR